MNILEYFSSLAEIPFYKFTKNKIFLKIFQNVVLDSPLLTMLARTMTNASLLLTTVLSPSVHSMEAAITLKARVPRTPRTTDRPGTMVPDQRRGCDQVWSVSVRGTLIKVVTSVFAMLVLK